jgi:hypothetical protein
MLTNPAAPLEPDMPLCFAIMPISMPPELLERYDNDPMHFLHVADHIFKPAAEEAGLEFRSPSTTSAEIVQAEIIGNLEKADLVLCDISTWNPNVFFELGIRVALDKPVAMVRDHHTERIPFDNSMINTHRYDGCLEIHRVMATVPRLAAFLNRAKTQNQNALWKYFGVTQRAARTDSEIPADSTGASVHSRVGGPALKAIQQQIHEFLVDQFVFTRKNHEEHVDVQLASGDHLVVAISLERNLLGSRKQWLADDIKRITRDSGFDGEHTTVKFHTVRKRDAP